MTEKMNALVLYGPKNFKIEEVSVPEVGFQEVLCRVKSIAICGATINAAYRHNCCSVAGRWNCFNWTAIHHEVRNG